MRGLVLYGANCTIEIWDAWKREFIEFDMVFVEYPHDILQTAKKVSDITNWIYSTYKDDKFDFIIGHSMGGIISLELVSKFGFECEKIIFIESNLKPAREFYRNLMLPVNMVKYGDNIVNMIKAEDLYYSKSLKRTLQEDFDYTEYIVKVKCKIYGIYGDRGVNSYSNRICDLCLEENIIDKIEFYFVKDSCHMPMVENPKELSDIIKNILMTSEVD
jgi:pimeloyl-ACP methyl ester carboxylesterase